MKEQKNNGNRHINDFYATHPNHVKEICLLENINGKKVLEPCSGMFHMSDELIKNGNEVTTNELFMYSDRKPNYNVDFLTEQLPHEHFDCVVMNPPFKHTTEFIEKAFTYSDKVYVFQKLSMLEGSKRYAQFYSKNLLEKVYVYSYRAMCAKGGEFENYSGNAIAFAWFCFNKKHNGSPEIKFIQK